MPELTTVEALRQDLKRFEYMEDFEQEAVADYFACPDLDTCELLDDDNVFQPGRLHNVCSACKVRWLLSKWEG